MTMYIYDTTTIVCATVTRVDESFDHEFGREMAFDYAIEDITVMATVGGLEQDVTCALSQKQIEYYTEWFREKYLSERAAS